MARDGATRREDRRVTSTGEAVAGAGALDRVGTLDIDGVCEGAIEGKDVVGTGVQARSSSKLQLPSDLHLAIMQGGKFEGNTQSLLLQHVPHWAPHKDDDDSLSVQGSTMEGLGEM